MSRSRATMTTATWPSASELLRAPAVKIVTWGYANISRMTFPSMNVKRSSRPRWG